MAAKFTVSSRFLARKRPLCARFAPGMRQRSDTDATARRQAGCGDARLIVRLHDDEAAGLSRTGWQRAG
ncbi:MAG: hypothetical protein CNE89_03520 [Sphingomonadaceae bacterium MED-G03]|nr:MAG: hypothetical protein CNE89_03520 [Sphingomonadaceae bacterium MED-G03]